MHLDKGGLVGPQLTALIAYLKGVCHASFSTTRTFLRDVVGVTLSRGQLSKILGKVSAALEKPYEQLLQALPDEAVLNVDETGHRDNGERWWTWCFRAELYTLYRIDAYRKAEVLMDTLGHEFRGVLGCDYFSAYRRYMKERGRVPGRTLSTKPRCSIWNSRIRPISSDQLAVCPAARTQPGSAEA